MKIERTELIENMKRFAVTGNGLIVGKPGVGKTYAIRQTIHELMDDGIYCVPILVDEFVFGTNAELQEVFKFEGGFLDALTSEFLESNASKAVLFIDAFDAARNEKVRHFFLSLVRDAVYGMDENWSIIVSVRTYDGKKSGDLSSLFGKDEEICGPNYHDNEIESRHFLVPPLNDAELEQVVTHNPKMGGAYNHASLEFKEILRIPFNLWLLENILENTIKLPDLSNIHSEIQLLDKYWQIRIRQKQNSDEREFILIKILRSMIADRSLTIRKEEIYGSITDDSRRECWNQLLSEEVIVEKSITKQKVSFSHNILFDFAISILLIEDVPGQVVDFILEEPSRPLFLRPSLNYHLTRLWYQERDIFWETFWILLSQTDIHLKLVSRIMPPSVLVKEANEMLELLPLIEKINRRSDNAEEAVLRLLQALRALDIMKDSLWAEFLVECARNIHQKFAWEMAITASEILERDKERIFVDMIGKVARDLLSWINTCRDKGDTSWFNSLGARLVMPLLASTYSSNIEESRRLLKGILEEVMESKIPMDYLYRLTDSVHSIFPYDKELVNEIYMNVFKHQEKSEEITRMGGYVLPMTSTKRQDFEMCQYHLVRQFEFLLQEDPRTAATICLKSLNGYIFQREMNRSHKRQLRMNNAIEFIFRNRNAAVIPDDSYIWDQNIHVDEPYKMADLLYKFLLSLSLDDDKEGLLADIMDIFAIEAIAAFFWKRLLRIGSENPVAFSSLLHDLCIAEPILSGEETIYEVGRFIEASAEYFSKDQLLSIEKAILKVEDINSRKGRRLLARIPPNMLQSDKGKRIRDDMEKKDDVPVNKPLFEIEVGVNPYTTEDYLKDKGVNVFQNRNRELMASISMLEEFNKKYLNEEPEQEAIDSIFSEAEAIYEVIIKRAIEDENLLETALTHLATCLANISKGVKDAQSKEYDLCRLVMLLCAKHPSPRANDEYEQEFDHPIWTSSPRTEAAMGLKYLGRIKYDKEVLEAIQALSADPVPSVRYVLMSNLSLISDTDEGLFWCLLNQVFNQEENKNIIDIACRNLRKFINSKQDMVVQALDGLASRAFVSKNYYLLTEEFVNIVIYFMIKTNREWAKKIFAEMLAKPVEYSEQLEKVASSSIGIMRQAYFDPAIGDGQITGAVENLMLIVGACTKSLEELVKESKLWETVDGEKPQDILESTKRVYGIIHEIVIRVYFAAGFEAEEKIASEGLEETRIFLTRIKPVLALILEYTSEEYGVMFAPTAHYFMRILNGMLRYEPVPAVMMASKVAKSSRAYGYNLDSLAIKEVVELVESVIADYRHEFQGGEALDDLLILLDIFTEVGWPEALKLVWRLDEIYR